MEKDNFKVFAIKYDGIVKELNIKDFDFLIISEDQIMLNKNKLKIFMNVTKGYKFTQEEIYIFENEFNKRLNKKVGESSASFFIKSDNKRCKLYGYILHNIGDLICINDILNMNKDYKHNDTSCKRGLVFLGIFENKGSYGKAWFSGDIISFVDKFDICKYFPGYLRNKDQWESYRNNNLTHSTFTSIANGSLKFNKTIKDFK